MRPPTHLVKAASVLTTLLIIASLAPTGCSQPTGPTVEVTLEDVGTIDTDPVEYNHVKVDATITTTYFLLGGTLNISADVYIDSIRSDWMVTVDPSEIDIPQGFDEQMSTVEVDVRVPPKATALSPAVLIVRANATTPASVVYTDEASTEMWVEQYYDLRMAANVTMTVEQGRNMTNRLRVTNNGNGRDNFTVVLNNAAVMEGKGLEVTFDETVYGIGPERTATIHVRVTAEADAQIGNAEALFTITSDGDSRKSETAKVTIVVKEGSPSNGGNGGVNQDDKDDNGALVGFGAIMTMVVIIGIALMLYARRLEERSAEDEEWLSKR